MAKQRAARQKLRGVDPQRVLDYIRANGLEGQFFNVRKRREVLEASGAVPFDFADNAYEVALDSAGLAAFQLMEEPISGCNRTAGLFGEVVVTETVTNDDGTPALDENGDIQTVQVRGLQHIIHGMCQEEYREFERRRMEEIKQQGRSLNSKRMLRNAYAERLGEEPMELPFPEWEEESEG